MEPGNEAIGNAVLNDLCLKRLLLKDEEYNV
jgi:hypothetical protein